VGIVKLFTAVGGAVINVELEGNLQNQNSPVARGPHF
jgi:hypothetical protein